ncbi:MAG: hypothetical protein AAF437_05075 [Pseudomonadota bacterium]
MNTIFTALLLSGLATTLPAFADSEGEYWRTETFTQEFNKQGGDSENFTYTGIKTASINPDVPEIRFGCSDRYGLTATITFRPLSEADPRNNKYLKFRYKNSNMTIEGRDTERVNWTFIKETRTIQTRRNKHAAMIYNAIVEQRPITIKEPYKKNVTLTPAPVDEGFIEFATGCSVTSGTPAS